jgi:nucleoid-associated protein YgaU
MRRARSFRWAPSRPLGLCVTFCLCACVSLLALPSRAQDAQPDSQSVAEAARAEKARKAAQQKDQSHIYTNEDLKKSQILTQQDRSRVEARKSNSPAAPAAPAAPADPGVNAEKNSAPESLGEVARRYRRQKLENAQAAEAVKQPASRFPMNLSQPSFAVPVQPAARNVAPNVAPSISPTLPPRSPAKALQKISPSRRDPFSRQRFYPALPNERAPLAPNFSTPARPALSLTAPAPRAPAVHAAAPPVGAPKLLLPAKPVPARPSLVPPNAPVALSIAHSGGKQIRIHPGDSLWKLARRHLGTGSRWSDLLAANPTISDPLHLQPGTVLVVPATELRSRVQPLSITVRSGDSLWKIAASQLGSANAWPCIAQANPQLRDANLLRPGQLLILPASCAKP